MKDHIEELLIQALLHLQRDGVLPKGQEIAPQVERSRSAEHGEFASNLAMVLAREAGRSPRELAQEIINRLPNSRQVERTEIAGPGFINFFMNRCALYGVIKDVLRDGKRYGHAIARRRQRVTVEFVSANPTGPLHVGHGRGAAYGASLAAILEAAGHIVQREYYVNDNGRQMDILATSVWLRYLELCGEQLRFPHNGYHGEYIYDIARLARSEVGDKWRFPGQNVLDDLAPDGPGGQAEVHIDALIERARTLLGDSGYRTFFDAALDTILKDIHDDLSEFGVEFDLWFSELELERSGAIQHAIDRLQQNGHLYVKDGATWFRASALGDEKDRVLTRENGRTTYFASDVAYFLNKLERGFEHAIYVFGADHHGYIARLQAAARGLGEDPESLEILLVQFAVLFREGEKVQMSTRSGHFITLRELREEVSSDAARYFYVMRSHDQHLDFDLDLAKSRSNENPVYYIQYAHARISSVFRNLDQMDLTHNIPIGEAALDLLGEAHELELMRAISRYPEVIESAARLRAPHILAHYLDLLATEFHAYYNAHQFLVDDENLRNARLNLILAAQRVLADGLGLLGIAAPEEM
ncbi:MAG: arginine--tRNA ligase [Xanthomonadales bacterium]|nr:arginine--tRNA ligase [Xanthomonadales bacterium]NIN60309.1 arginine--tRNA ligase [Xanthomonadales bacterium]NIN75661.1 arginine--tRNA ligase [Xanthomonadales bacterium]NIO14734.1 arginine--tRNA ligase [Xanthomonadales bacterium]NIP12702.1 arginine--tRNA ligase [Xanthomonadales bacterium]